MGTKGISDAIIQIYSIGSDYRADAPVETIDVSAVGYGDHQYKSGDLSAGDYYALIASDTDPYTPTVVEFSLSEDQVGTDYIKEIDASLRERSKAEFQVTVKDKADAVINDADIKYKGITRPKYCIRHTEPDDTTTYATLPLTAMPIITGGIYAFRDIPYGTSYLEIVPDDDTTHQHTIVATDGISDPLPIVYPPLDINFNIIDKDDNLLTSQVTSIEITLSPRNALSIRSNKITLNRRGGAFYLHTSKDDGNRFRIPELGITQLLNIPDCRIEYRVITGSESDYQTKSDVVLAMDDMEENGVVDITIVLAKKEGIDTKAIVQYRVFRTDGIEVKDANVSLIDSTTGVETVLPYSTSRQLYYAEVDKGYYNLSAYHRDYGVYRELNVPIMDTIDANIILEEVDLDREITPIR